MPVNPARPRPLVVGVSPSLTWAVARCLARAGTPPVVLGWHRVSPMAFLPDCRRYVPWRGVRWIDGELDPSLAGGVEEACRVHGADVVVAADYDATILLGRAGAIPGARIAPVPPPQSVRSLHDKWRFSRMLELHGLPRPETELVNDSGELARTSIPFPIVTKPLAKWAGVGFRVHATRAHLQQAIAGDALGEPFPLLVQRFVPGSDVGFSFLAHEGRIVAYSTFEHLRGGRRRFFDDPRLRRHVEVLLAATGYSGVGHFDTRHDDGTDTYRFLELNPRFWASLLYALHAGVNYPDLLVRLPEAAPATPVTARGGLQGLPPWERAVTIGIRRWEGAYTAGYRLLERRVVPAQVA